MWRPKQKALYEAAIVAAPQSHLSREGKGKMHAYSNETASREVTTATMPSPNSGAVTPCASLVLMSEATMPQGTHDVHSRKARTRAPQCASFPYSSSTKLTLSNETKRLSLSADSGAYAASVPRALPKLLAANLEPKHYPRLITFVAT